MKTNHNKKKINSAICEESCTCKEKRCQFWKENSVNQIEKKLCNFKTTSQSKFGAVPSVYVCDKTPLTGCSKRKAKKVNTLIDAPYTFFLFCVFCVVCWHLLKIMCENYVYSRCRKRKRHVLRGVLVLWQCGSLFIMR